MAIVETDALFNVADAWRDWIASFDLTIRDEGGRVSACRTSSCSDRLASVLLVL
jgi:hypothetical protein